MLFSTLTHGTRRYHIDVQRLQHCKVTSPRQALWADRVLDTPVDTGQTRNAPAQQCARARLALDHAASSVVARARRRAAHSRSSLVLGSLARCGTSSSQVSPSLCWEGGSVLLVLPRSHVRPALARGVSHARSRRAQLDTGRRAARAACVSLRARTALRVDLTSVVDSADRPELTN